MAWAQFSEKLSDEVDSAIKYGGGNKELISLLAMLSDATMDVEIAIKAKDANRMAIELQRSAGLFGRLQEIIHRLREGKR